MKRRTFVTTAGATLASLAVAGCMGDDGTPTDEGTPTDATSPTDEGVGEAEASPFDIEGHLGDQVDDDVEVVSSSVFQTGTDIGVTGVIENTAEKPIESATVTVKLLDGDTTVGESVDEATEDLSFLAPGNRWRFWVSFADEVIRGATDFEINVDATVDEAATWWRNSPYGIEDVNGTDGNSTVTAAGNETVTDGNETD